MSIGLFFIVFFALIVAGIVWIARSPSVQPLDPESLPRDNPASPHYDPYLDPAHSLFVGRDDD